MNKFWKGALLNIAGIYAFTLLYAIVGGWGVFLFVPLVISGIEFFVGIILLLPDTTRKAAQIMLAASGIVLLIGISVCSVFPLKL